MQYFIYIILILLFYTQYKYAAPIINTFTPNSNTEQPKTYTNNKFSTENKAQQDYEKAINNCNNKKYSICISLLEKVIQTTKSKYLKATSHTQVGGVYHRLNNYNKAIESYYKAREVNPLYIPASEKLISVLNATGKHDAAKKVADDLQKIDPNNELLQVLKYVPMPPPSEIINIKDAPTPIKEKEEIKNEEPKTDKKKEEIKNKETKIDKEKEETNKKNEILKQIFEAKKNELIKKDKKLNDDDDEGYNDEFITTDKNIRKESSTNIKHNSTPYINITYDINIISLLQSSPVSSFTIFQQPFSYLPMSLTIESYPIKKFKSYWLSLSINTPFQAIANSIIADEKFETGFYFKSFIFGIGVLASQANFKNASVYKYNSFLSNKASAIGFDFKAGFIFKYVNPIFFFESSVYPRYIIANSQTINVKGIDYDRSNFLINFGTKWFQTKHHITHRIFFKFSYIETYINEYKVTNLGNIGHFIAVYNLAIENTYILRLTKMFLEITPSVYSNLYYINIKKQNPFDNFNGQNFLGINSKDSQIDGLEGYSIATSLMLIEKFGNFNLKQKISYEYIFGLNTHRIITTFGIGYNY